MSIGSERTLSALGDIGDGLKSAGESFAAIAGESRRQRHAVQDLGTKLDKLQATADEIKTAVADDKAQPVEDERL